MRETRWLRWSVACVWLVTGVAVLHPYYRAVGSEYLGRLGLPNWPMVATCAAEIVLALCVALGPASTWITFLQLATVLTFTAILGCVQPLLLANPFGMLTKNLPLLAVVVTAWLVEREGWSRRAIWLLRCGVALIWITEGIFPKILFQQQVELDMVTRSGLVPWPPPIFLAGLGIAELVAGVATLLLRSWPLRVLLVCQLAALIALPLLAGFLDWHLWVHPFMPLVKNVPILVGTALLLWQSGVGESSRAKDSSQMERPPDLFPA